MIEFKRLKTAEGITVQRIVNGEIIDAMTFNETGAGYVNSHVTGKDGYVQNCGALDGKRCDGGYAGLMYSERVRNQSILVDKYEELQKILEEQRLGTPVKQ